MGVLDAPYQTPNKFAAWSAKQNMCVEQMFGGTAKETNCLRTSRRSSPKIRKRRALQLIKPGGSLVSSVVAPSKELAAARSIHTTFFIVRITAGHLTRIAHLFDSGKIRPNIGTVLPLSRAREAHEMLAGSLVHARGKIVFDVTSS